MSQFGSVLCVPAILCEYTLFFTPEVQRTACQPMRQWCTEIDAIMEKLEQQNEDMRTKGWLFRNSAANNVLFLIGYFLLLRVGRKVMANRRPFSLRKFMVCYNIALSLFNLYFSVKTFSLVLKLNYSWACEPIIYGRKHSTDELSMELAVTFYWVFISRVVELLETFIYVLRKKDQQLTFLHLYHHGSVYTFGWMILFVGAQGQLFQIVIWNCLVHFFMYLYYTMTAMGPRFNKYKWVKIYITRMQLVQFLAAIIHLIVGDLFLNCPIIWWVKVMAFTYMLTLLYLFGNFYSNTYNKQKEMFPDESEIATPSFDEDPDPSSGNLKEKSARRRR